MGAPGIIASIALVLFLPWMAWGPWAGSVAVVCWVAIGLGTLTRRGEQALLEVVAKWEPIDLAEAVGQSPVQRLRQSLSDGLDQFTFYREPSSKEPNALCLGGSSVGLTRSFLELCDQGVLGEDEIVAVLMHEVEHHRGGALRWSGMSAWFQLPYLTVSSIGRSAVTQLVAERPWLAWGLPVVAVLVAAAALSALPVLMVAVVIVTLLLVFGALPVMAGGLSQAEEFRADAAAADRGCASGLVEYLSRYPVLDQNWWQRACDTHPAPSARIARLNKHPGPDSG